MPGWIWLAIGLALVGAVCLDVVLTTILVSRGSGPLTEVVTWLCSRLGDAARRFYPPALTGLGPFTVCAILLTWGALLCTGWLLVFCALSESFMRASGGGPAPFLDRLYHVLVVVWGRGSGPAEPSGAWFLAEQAAGLTGLLIVSLSISYVIPIVGAVAHMRHVASSIHALGRTPLELLTRAWREDEQDFGGLHLHCVQLGSGLCLAAQRHLAYPPLQFFYSPSADAAISVQLAKLHVTLDLLDHACLRQIDRCTLESTRNSLGGLLQRLGTDGSAGRGQAFELPDLSPLADAGIPLRPRAEAERRLREQRDAYDELTRLLVSSGFDWEQVLEVDGEGQANPERPAHERDPEAAASAR